MKALLVCLYLIGGISFINAQTNPDSLWMVDNYVKEEVMVPMRDGVCLFTSIYRPKEGKDHPILLTRTPYSSVPYGKDFRPWWNGHFNEYVRHNYILVIQDVRGRWRSEGTFVNIRPLTDTVQYPGSIDESTDSYDTMEWLVNNVQGNNGKIGVYGGSYGGFYTLMAALSRHPALRAINPQAPVTDWFIGDDFHHNGAFFLMDAFSFFTEQDKFRSSPTSTYNTSSPFPYVDNYDFFLKNGALKNFTALPGDSIPFWNDLMVDRTYRPWWYERTVTNFLKDLTVPTLVVGSPFDAENTYGGWETYRRMREMSPASPLTLVMGPWYHMQWVRDTLDFIGNIHFPGKTSRWYAEHMEYPFFHNYLLGQGKWEVPNGTANIYISGRNQWHTFPHWPPPDIEHRAIYLRAQQKLSWTPSQESQGESSYVSDPSRPVPYTEGVHRVRTLTYMTDDQRFAARRPDVLVFQTDVLEEDLTLAGPLVADLQVRVSTTDADFVVKVIDVFPEDFSYGDPIPSRHRRIPSSTYPMGGYQMLVRGEVFRGKFRKSFDKPEPFVPNQPEQVRFTLPDVAYTFKKGHRLMVQIQSSWFPLVDRNPQQFIDIYNCTDEDFVPSIIRILHNSIYSSKLILPVLSAP